MENEFFGKPGFSSKVTMPSLYVIIFLLMLSSCSVTKKIDKQAKQLLLQDSVIGTGHIGISVFDPAANSYWYNYNAEKYFTPASNTKLFSLYAGMKYLGDSLVGLRYKNQNGNYFLYPTGDPTFLHPDFSSKNVFNFLKTIPAENWKGIVMDAWQEKSLGYGWSWDDYSDDYMVERSAMPVYGNVVTFSFQNDSLVGKPYGKFDIVPGKEIELDQKEKFTSRSKSDLPENFSIKRKLSENAFEYSPSGREFSNVTIPLIQNEDLLKELLIDTLHSDNLDIVSIAGNSSDLSLSAIRSQPTDSLFKPMMHYSDNFFAEQTLLMVSNEKLGVMNDEKIIDTLLKSDLKDIPQMPQWVDGSGLSRYNLFTPKDFVYLLNKMKNEFGLERLKVILPTGGEGTIKNYYKEDSGFIYVKTGTLSNQVALSGYLITQKNKLLIFSLLANNVNGSATDVRRAFERFLKALRKKF